MALAPNIESDRGMKLEKLTPRFEICCNEVKVKQKLVNWSFDH